MPYEMRVLMTYDAVFGYSMFMLPILWLDSVLNERNAGNTVTDMGTDITGMKTESGCHIMSGEHRVRNRSIYLYQHPV